MRTECNTRCSVSDKIDNAYSMLCKLHIYSLTFIPTFIHNCCHFEDNHYKVKQCQVQAPTQQKT